MAEPVLQEKRKTSDELTRVRRMLEVIVTDAREAVVAGAAGASRLELVAGRERGGLTPDAQTVERVLRVVELPVHVIVRPHDRGFNYAPSDRRQILAAAAVLGESGASALVFGALDESGNVDTAFVREVSAAFGGELTFHRAFDESADPAGAYDLLAGVPEVTRVLTSGAGVDAWSGRSLIASLVRKGRGPTVLAGVGIDEHNVAALIEATGASEIHVGGGARTGGRLDPRKIERLAALIGV